MFEGESVCPVVDNYGEPCAALANVQTFKLKFCISLFLAINLNEPTLFAVAMTSPTTMSAARTTTTTTTTTRLSWEDIVIVVAYFIAVILVGLYVRKIIIIMISKPLRMQYQGRLKKY